MPKISKRNDGRWWTRIPNPTDKAKRMYVYGKTKKEVQNKANKILGKIENGTYIEPTSITLKQWLCDWLEGRKPHLEESSWNLYELMIRQHINPDLGEVKVCNLTTRDIQKLLNQKFNNGRVDGEGGLSSRTVKYIYQTLNSALSQAVRERLITFNAAEAIELPKQSKKEINPFSTEELKLFFKTAERSPYYVAFWLLVSTGLRKGELLGLHWNDIDFDKQQLIIRQQLVRTKENGLLLKNNTKTEKSKRIIKLNKVTINLLKSHLRKQNTLKLMIGPYDEEENMFGYHDVNLVFSTKNGKPLDPKNFSRSFKSLLTKAGLSEELRVHDLRHTYATLSLENGVQLKTISENLGHSSITITADTYSHVTDNMKTDAAERIGYVLAPLTKKEAQDELQ